MSIDSHNHTASKPNPALLPNEHSETDHYPSDREILVAMVSELCAECARVNADDPVLVICFHMGCDSVVIEIWDGESATRLDVGLCESTAHAQLVAMIARVSALGAES